MFASPSFFAVVALLAVLYWAVPRSVWRRGLLLLASFAFLATFAGAYAAPLVAATVCTYWLAEIATQRRTKALLVAALLAPVALLLWTKWPTAAPGGAWWVAPLGVSYVTFQLLHYAVERYRGGTPPADLASFTRFSLFFPSLAAGPIKRYPNFTAQEQRAIRFDGERIAWGVFRIALGLAKKLVLAQSLEPMVADFAQAGSLSASAWRLWLATYAYTFQIYFDFSGYTDVALGLALVFGYRIEENFNWPYLARNASDFWKRWHMSLSSWVRDYLFIPLGGSRVPEGRVALNTLAAMSVIGLWHGLQLNFLAWGLYHALGLLVFRWFTKWRARARARSAGWVGRAAAVLLTFHFVAIGWVFFANDLARALLVLQTMFGLR
jgi:alginate O-acetyltransferase complex protein AlgI